MKNKMHACMSLCTDVSDLHRMSWKYFECLSNGIKWHLTAIEYHSNAFDLHRMSFGTFDDIECHAMYEDIPIPFNDMWKTFDGTEWLAMAVNDIRRAFDDVRVWFDSIWKTFLDMRCYSATFEWSPMTVECHSMKFKKRSKDMHDTLCKLLN